MKRAALPLITVLIPVLFFVTLEGVLRLAGIGSAERAAFVPLPGKSTHQALNPDYVRRYFQGFQPAVAFHPFARTKTKDTFRVFVMGGSSTAGYPYHFYHSFSEELRSLLQEAAPERNVEVINLGMSAVNSYTLWDLSKKLVGEAPDAVIIYAGHNEYYGAFGVGSSINSTMDMRWLKRLTLRLKNLALYNALESILIRSAEATQRQTLMARVVSDASIGFDSDVYEQGLAQYEHNMRDVLATFARSGIPTYVGTLLSNLKDQAPLGDSPEAMSAFDEGQQLLREGRAEEARIRLLEAKEYDGLRFRAPEALNQRLQGFAQDGLATYVDLTEAIRSFDAAGLPGDLFFDDHLHPNAAGHARIAAFFYDAMRQDWNWLPPRDTLTTTVSIDPIQATYARLQVDILKADYPFNKANSDASETVRRLVRSATMRSSYDSLGVIMATQEAPPPELLNAGLAIAKQSGDTLAALSLYKALLHWQPFNATIIREATSYALSTTIDQDMSASIVAFGWARTRSLDHLNAWAALSIQQQRYDTADRLLHLAEQRDPNSRVMLFNKARLLVVQGDTTGARSYFERYRAQQ